MAAAFTSFLILVFLAGINRAEENASKGNWRIWDLLELMTTLRKGHAETMDDESPNLLRDPAYLYSTFYKSGDDPRASSGIMTGILDYLQTEYRVKKLNEMRSSAQSETKSDSESSSKELISMEANERSKRQLPVMPSSRQSTAIKPYSPYLGAIIWVFPVLSFTVPFGAYLKLFGFDLM